ncbi:MAG TPA: diaminopimelate epimerase [Candidatus Aquilonibacter sp.]|nr:diaminopimelate epimerase [Candidatus Aquilonibacter sp.]
MIARVAATKMHGALNDFVVIDTRADGIAVEPELARRLCDRHAGVGADGVLLIGESARADAFMRVLNADGSEAEMCGNGIRCVARYLDERGEGAQRRIETLAGIYETAVESRGDTYRIRVAMGTPRLIERSLPFGDATLVDTGNPHVVLFRDRIDDIDVHSLGEELQSNALFPDGTNVHVAHVQSANEMMVKHYERGAGLTMACGTGAVACVVAARARGQAGTSVVVHVPGGDLRIDVDERGFAQMTGPAVSVFETSIDLGRLERA